LLHSDNNECREAALDRRTLCPQPQLCENTPGSFQCVCPSGTEMINMTCRGTSPFGFVFENIHNTIIETCLNEKRIAKFLPRLLLQATGKSATILLTSGWSFKFSDPTILLHNSCFSLVGPHQEQLPEISTCKSLHSGGSRGGSMVPWNHPFTRKHCWLCS